MAGVVAPPVKGGVYVALEDYEAKAKTELSLAKGDKLKVVKVTKDDNSSVHL